jgi:hypothetical protein
MRLLLVDDESTVHGDYKVEPIMDCSFGDYVGFYMEGDPDPVSIEEIEQDIIALHKQGVK